MKFPEGIMRGRRVDTEILFRWSTHFQRRAHNDGNRMKSSNCLPQPISLSHFVFKSIEKKSAEFKF
jgi:hypothetical protein